ncbi:MAG: hypothetical protein QCH99_03595 [Candidatus Bathyarchaeota archaeon]|nr:hypothetical protein [Candidatus Bathyarchaeum tardum]
MSVKIYLDSASDRIKHRYYQGGTVSPIDMSKSFFDVYAKIVESVLSSSASLDYSKEYTKSPRCIHINRINLGNRPIELARDIPALVKLNKEGYLFENNELGIFTVNRNFDQGLEEFKEDISFLITEYGEATEADLTQDARQLRQRILTYVRR